MFGIGWFKKEELAHKVARFRHIKPGDPHVHHDALEFPNGKIVLLTQGRSARGSAPVAGSIKHRTG